MAPPRDPFGIVGSTIDRRYVVRRMVAEGGFGVVYEAEATQLGVQVALKVLRVDVAQGSDARARFEQEAKLLVRLRHPAIVELTDAAHLEDGTPYLVLQWIEGETLDVRIQRLGPVPIDEVIALLSPVASAIEHAHAQGVIHRDLKPANLMTTDSPGTLSTSTGLPRVKVLDFGVARWSHAHGVKTTTVSSTGLSVGYAAPEQYGKEFGPVDGRADQFSLAAIVYSALTAEAPFAGDTLTEVMFATCYKAERPSAIKARPDVPALVDEVLRKALSIRPDDRFKTIHAFWAALVSGAQSAEVGGAPSTDRTGPPQVSGVAGSGNMPTVVTLPAAVLARKPLVANAVASALGSAPTERAGSLPELSAARRAAPPPQQASERAAGGTIREGYAPPPSSQPMSSVRSSRPATRWFTRIMVVIALGCIVGGGLYVVPLLFPEASGSGSGKKPKVTATPRPTSSPSVSGSVSASASAIDHGPCGDLPETMACIVSSKLQRGPSDGCNDNDPPHRAACPWETVKVETFAIDKKEVSAGRYKKCVEETKCRAIAAVGTGELPARNVAWADARAFCDWNQKRLPTDSEWELTAAGSPHREYPWGNQSPGEKLAVYSISGGTPRTEPVEVGVTIGGATPDGVLDLAGNVAEWTSALAFPKAPIPVDLEASDAAVAGTRRWVRGGSYASDWGNLRTWAREAYPETYAAPTLGFRCALTPKK